MRVLMAALSGCVFLSSAALAGNGDPVGGHPNYRERAILALTNACRQGPQAYRDAYLGNARILKAANYPAVGPLYWTLPLNRSARAHSADMASAPCFQHDSCDGTDLWDRIGGYYKDATSMAENIASGYRTPLAAVNGLLLDGGAPDRSRGDGHRKNIMAAKFREMGSGCAFGGPMRTYDTQDFGNGAPDFESPLVSGAHVVGDERITFLASWAARKAPADATLLLEGEAIPLRVAFGTRENGTYRVTLPAGDGCRRYRFRFKDDAGHEWNYPEGGALFTTGEGGCSREYESTGRLARAR
jgi:hypothetical protein